MCTEEQLSDVVDIFIAHRTHLCRVAMKILGSSERADDVVHDAYIKIVETRVLVDVRQPLAYIRRVVRNLAIDRYRRSQLESHVFAVEEEGSNIASSVTPETISISRQQLQRVASALEELPERTRHVFELCRMGGRTQRDIAQMLNISPTLVNFMIRDALLHCRKKLQEGEL